MTQWHLSEQNSLEQLFEGCKADSRFPEVRWKGVSWGGAGDGESPRAKRRGETSWNAEFTRRCGPKFRSTRNGCDRDAVFDEERGARLFRQQKTSRHSLYVIHEAASSQWSRSRIKVVTWSLYCNCRSRWAAALITLSRRRSCLPASKCGRRKLGQSRRWHPDCVRSSKAGWDIPTAQQQAMSNSSAASMTPTRSLPFITYDLFFDKPVVTKWKHR